MYATIIVPLDGSASAEAAIPAAVSIAGRAGATVELVHVHAPAMPGETLEALPQYRYQHVDEFDDRYDAGAAERELERMDARAGELSARHRVPVRARLLRGPVAVTLAAYAATSGAQLIVMATHGEGGWQRQWLGGTSDALVRQASIPVLLVRPGGRTPAERPIEHLLVPVDGSAFSESILPPALELASMLAAKVTLLEVVQPDGSPVRALPGLRRAPAAREHLERLVHRLPEHLPRPEIRTVTHPHPATAILDEAENGAYDLVAMATHGRGGVRQWILGSTADKVLRGTETPILLLRPHVAMHPSPRLIDDLMPAV